jgi:cytidine deaminase
MDVQLTKDEQKLVDYAKKAVAKYNAQRKAKGGIDTIYAFVLSDSGKIYDGACLESTIESAGVCAERLAIGNMILNETYKAKIISVVTFDPVPNEQEESSTPCGTCRHVIWENGSPNTTVICGQYIQRKNGWEFVPKMEKYTIKELYPKPYKMVKWN